MRYFSIALALTFLVSCSGTANNAESLNTQNLELSKTTVADPKADNANRVQDQNIKIQNKNIDF
ncbi:MAG: hypothetical protein ACK4NC_02865 [Candidatus Gracilibacteria bacterium]